MKTIKEAFDKATPPPKREMIIRYGILRQNKRCTLCIVEGPGDQAFYSHTNIGIFANNYCYYICHDKAKDPDSRYESRAAVIQTYFDIKNDEILKGDLARTIFIVDKDYDRQLVHNKQLLPTKDSRCITVTRYHSLENYFITEGNVKTIFTAYNVDVKLVNDFLTKIRKFTAEVAEYFALLGSITACYKHDWRIPNYVNYRKDLFKSLHFDRSGNYRFDVNGMKTEIEKMRFEIRYIREAKEYEQYLLKKLSDYKYIRGHLAFDFLRRYLKEVLGKEFGYDSDNKEVTTKYYRCIHALDIEIHIVTGLGKKLYDGPPSIS